MSGFALGVALVIFAVGGGWLGAWLNDRLAPRFGLWLRRRYYRKYGVVLRDGEAADGSQDTPS